MGRIRIGSVKRDAKKILSLDKGNFTTKFEDNKKAVDEIAEIKTKKLRNLIAGYITKKMKTS